MDSQLDGLITSYSKGQRDKLIPLLQDIQDAIGYLPEEAIPKLARHLQIPEVKIYSVATFYNQFHFEPRGRFHLQVCNGTGCYLDGSARIMRELNRLLGIDAGQTTQDRLFSLEAVPCLGACQMAPVLSVNGEFHGQLTSRKLLELLDQLRNR